MSYSLGLYSSLRTSASRDFFRVYQSLGHPPRSLLSTHHVRPDRIVILLKRLRDVQTQQAVVARYSFRCGGVCSRRTAVAVTVVRGNGINRGVRYVTTMRARPSDGDRDEFQLRRRKARETETRFVYETGAQWVVVVSAFVAWETTCRGRSSPVDRSFLFFSVLFLLLSRTAAPQTTFSCENHRFGKHVDFRSCRFPIVSIYKRRICSVTFYNRPAVHRAGTLSLRVL